MYMYVFLYTYKYVYTIYFSFCQVGTRTISCLSDSSSCNNFLFHLFLLSLTENTDNIKMSSVGLTRPPIRASREGK